MSECDVIDDDIRHEIAEALAFRTTAADVGGGYLQRRHVGDEDRPVGRFVQRSRAGSKTCAVFGLQRRIGAGHCIAQRRSAGALQYHDMRQLEQAFPFVPGVQLQECIAAKDEAQRLFGAKLGAQCGERFHGIAGVGAEHLVHIDEKVGMPVQGQAHHFPAGLCGSLRCCAVRRRAAGDEAHLGKLALLQRFLRDAQMPIVNGIEGAA